MPMKQHQLFRLETLDFRRVRDLAPRDLAVCPFVCLHERYR